MYPFLHNILDVNAIKVPISNSMKKESIDSITITSYRKIMKFLQKYIVLSDFCFFSLVEYWINIFQDCNSRLIYVFS